MVMDMVLSKLEERIEEMVGAFAAAKEREMNLQARVSELEAQVGELESTLEERTGATARVEELEEQKKDLAQRLERVVAVIDKALDTTDS